MGFGADAAQNTAVTVSDEYDSNTTPSEKEISSASQKGASGSAHNKLVKAVHSDLEAHYSGIKDKEHPHAAAARQSLDEAAGHMERSSKTGHQGAQHAHLSSATRAHTSALDSLREHAAATGGKNPSVTHSRIRDVNAVAKALTKRMGSRDPEKPQGEILVHTNESRPGASKKGKPTRAKTRVVGREHLDTIKAAAKDRVNRTAEERTTARKLVKRFAPTERGTVGRAPVDRSDRGLGTGGTAEGIKVEGFQKKPNSGYKGAEPKTGRVTTPKGGTRGARSGRNSAFGEGGAQ